MVTISVPFPLKRLGLGGKAISSMGKGDGLACVSVGFGMSVYEGWCVLGGGERDSEGQLLSLDGLLGFGAGRRLSWAGSPVARTPGEGSWQRRLDAQAMPPFPSEKIRRTGATPGNARAAGVTS